MAKMWIEKLFCIYQLRTLLILNHVYLSFKYFRQNFLYVKFCCCIGSNVGIWPFSNKVTDLFSFLRNKKVPETSTLNTCHMSQLNAVICMQREPASNFHICLFSHVYKYNHQNIKLYANFLSIFFFLLYVIHKHTHVHIHRHRHRHRHRSSSIHFGFLILVFIIHS